MVRETRAGNHALEGCGLCRQIRSPWERGGGAMKNANLIVEEAKAAARSAETWADLSNALFDPVNGLITRACPTPGEREAFLKTQQYSVIRDLLRRAMAKHGLVEGATPKKSGRFVVRLPRSLHAALEAEAEDEGVSLNQLVVTKLAVQMSRLAASSMPEMALIAQAYLEVREGYSTDRVVADP